MTITLYAHKFAMAASVFLRGRNLLMLLCLCLLGISTAAQTPACFNYNIEQGLPSNEVYDIHQDRDGFLWFATDNGVVRYDGHDMELFNVGQGLVDPVVFRFVPDTKGRLWMRSYSGNLCYYDNGKIKPYFQNDTLSRLCSNTIMTQLIVDDEDKIWFCAPPQMTSLDSHGHVETREVKRGESVILSVEDRYLGPGFRLSQSVTELEIDGKHLPIKIRDVSTDNINSETVAWRDKIYFYINSELFEYDGALLRAVFLGPSSIISLSLDDDNDMWIGMKNNGVVKLDHVTLQQISPNVPDLKGRSVTRVIQDNEGGYWFGTLENGVYYLPNINITNYALQPSKTRAALSLPDKLVIGDYSGNLTAIDNSTREIEWRKQLTGSIVTMYTDPFRQQWVSTSAFIYVFDEQFKDERRQLNNGASFFTTDDNEHIIRLNRYRVHLLDKTGAVQSHVDTDHVYRSLVRFQDSLYLATLRLGFQILDERFKVIREPAALHDLKISKVLVVNDTLLVCGTLGSGFVVMNTNTWEPHVTSQELGAPIVNVYDLQLRDNKIWMATAHGLNLIDKDSLINKKLYIAGITRRKGVVSNSIAQMHFTSDAVWLLSDHAFSVVPYKYVNDIGAAPRFYWKGAEVNGDDVPIERLANLRHNENDILIKFGFISFNNQDIYMRYRLRAQDRWTYSKERTIQLSSLAPGDYALEAESSVDNVHWANVNKIVTVVVNAPFYMRWYSVLTAIAVAGGALAFYFLSKLKTQREKQVYLSIINEHQQKLIQSEVETLERERGRISKELHDSVSTNLTAIKMSVRNLLQHHDLQKADVIEGQFQLTLRELKEIIYDLTPPGLEHYGLEVALKSYLDRIGRDLPTRIHLNFFGSKALTPSMNLSLFRIVQELIGNTLKHAAAGNINIHVSIFDDLVSLVFEDDGVGFQPNNGQGGLGLDSIESRVTAMHGTMRFDTGKFGTSYSIDIPLNSNLTNQSL